MRRRKYIRMKLVHHVASELLIKIERSDDNGSHKIE